MNLLNHIPVWLIAGASGYFILWLLHRVCGVKAWPKRLFIPYFFGELNRWRRLFGIASQRWLIIANVVIAAALIALHVCYRVAIVFQLQFPEHVAFCAQISVNLPFPVGGLVPIAYYVVCDHPEHMVPLVAVGWIVLCGLLNLFALLFLRVENVGAAILRGFIGAGIFKKGEATITLQRAYSYSLQSGASFTFNAVLERLNAIQRGSGVRITGIADAPPSELLVIASRGGLPKPYNLSRLPAALSDMQPSIGLAPFPVYHDLVERPQIGVAGPSGSGKSTLARTIAAQMNIATAGNIVNVFVDIGGVDYAGVDCGYDESISRVGRTVQAIRAALPRLPTVVYVQSLDETLRVLQLLYDEMQSRARYLRANGLTSIRDAADVTMWQTPKIFPKIMIFWDGFSVCDQLYSKQSTWKSAMQLLNVIVIDGRKYGLHCLVVTTRASYDIFDAARDEFRWYGVGRFRMRQGQMIFESALSGVGEVGSFTYEMPSPFEGFGVARAPDTPLFHSRYSLSAVLTASASRAPALAQELGQKIRRDVFRLQDSAELENVLAGLRENQVSL